MLKKKEAQPGFNLVLTLDRDLQQRALEAMNRKDKIGPRIGALIAVKTNGEILSWLSTPAFDPNLFASGIESQAWRQIVTNPQKPLRNKGLQDHYSPGSTFKPFVALAALEEKIIETDSILKTPAFLLFYKRKYHDHKRGGYGQLSVKEALEVSSNVFFYQLGIQLGIEKMFPLFPALWFRRKNKYQLAPRNSWPYSQ